MDQARFQVRFSKAKFNREMKLSDFTFRLAGEDFQTAGQGSIRRRIVTLDVGH